MTRTKIHYTFVEMSPKIQNFYSQFMDEDHIELKNDIAAEHGFVRYIINLISCIIDNILTAIC